MDYIKVVGEDMMCWKVHKETLEPLSTTCYDPYAWSGPEPVETITHADWLDRKYRYDEN